MSFSLTGYSCHSVTVRNRLLPLLIRIWVILPHTAGCWSFGLALCRAGGGIASVSMSRLFETLDKRRHASILRSRWSLSVGLLRFSLFEAVEKSVQYLTRDFLFPFEMAGGGMALRDILVVKEQAVTFDTTVPLAVRIV